MWIASIIACSYFSNANKGVVQWDRPGQEQRHRRTSMMRLHALEKVLVVRGAPSILLLPLDRTKCSPPYARATDAHPPPSLHLQRMATSFERSAEEGDVAADVSEAEVSDADRSAWQRMSGTAIVEVLAPNAEAHAAVALGIADAHEMADRARVAAAFAGYLDEL